MAKAIGPGDSPLGTLPQASRHLCSTKVHKRLLPHHPFLGLMIYSRHNFAVQQPDNRRAP